MEAYQARRPTFLLLCLLFSIALPPLHPQQSSSTAAAAASLDDGSAATIRPDVNRLFDARDSDDDDDDDDVRDSDARSGSFLHKTVLSSEAGEMMLLLPRDTDDDELARQNIGLSFLTLEPDGLLLPHYTDSDYLFIVFKGKGRLSWIDDGNEIQLLELEEGDVHRIESGTVFYFLNHGPDKNDGDVEKHERMHVFGIHDWKGEPGYCTSSTTAKRAFINVAGPETILSGFDEDVLATAFNVSRDDAYDLLTSPLLEEGPFIFHTATRNESSTSSSSSAGRNESVVAVRNESVPMVGANESSASSSSSSSKERGEEQHEPAGFVDVLLDALLEDDDDGDAAAANSIMDLSPKTILKEGGGGGGALNMFKKEPIFRNEYGSTSVADENDSALLKKANKGVFWVKLKPGSMLAPHWNPRAMEVALVTKGKGEVQIVSPGDGASGHRGKKLRIREGSVFYVPRNFGMCQMTLSSGGEPLQFVGFSTSSRPNHPQFLAGSGSVLTKLDADVLASAFNVPTEYAKRFLGQQMQAVIVPVP